MAYYELDIIYITTITQSLIESIKDSSDTIVRIRNFNERWDSKIFTWLQRLKTHDPNP